MTLRIASTVALAVALLAAVALAVLARAAFSLEDGRSDRTGSRLVARAVGGGTDAPLRDVIARFDASRPEGGEAGADARQRALADLARLAERGEDPTTRSLASNLLGALAFEEAVLDPEGAQADLAASADAFADAVRIDPRNTDAKFNLELLLTLRERDGDDAGSGAAPGTMPTAPGADSGAGSTPAGQGY